ncbi:hypothetical protein U1Q18_017147 [Sarracenia purpurea var. burkii]
MITMPTTQQHTSKPSIPTSTPKPYIIPPTHTPQQLTHDHTHAARATSNHPTTYRSSYHNNTPRPPHHMFDMHISSLLEVPFSHYVAADKHALTNEDQAYGNCTKRTSMPAIGALESPISTSYAHASHTHAIHQTPIHTAQQPTKTSHPCTPNPTQHPTIHPNSSHNNTPDHSISTLDVHQILNLMFLVMLWKVSISALLAIYNSSSSHTPKPPCKHLSNNQIQPQDCPT